MQPLRDCHSREALRLASAPVGTERRGPEIGPLVVGEEARR
jgi:hypothetical protein